MKLYAHTDANVSFADFEGQSVWVKVYDREWQVYSYLQVVSVTGDSMRYRYVPDYFIEEEFDYVTDMLKGIENKVHTCKLSEYELVLPIQIISDTDLEDCINA